MRLDTTVTTALTRTVIDHHLDALGARDLPATMADYHPEAILITPDGTLRGAVALRHFFASLFEEFAQPGSSYDVLRREVHGDLAYLQWTAETPWNRYELASDTFIVHDARIVAQTFAGTISPLR